MKVTIGLEAIGGGLMPTVTVRIDITSVPVQKESILGFGIQSASFEIGQDLLKYQFLGDSREDPSHSAFDKEDEDRVNSRSELSRAITSIGKIESTSSNIGYGSALVLDPTGTVFRFSQIIQIINKLYFVNVHFGRHLDPVLKRTAYSVKEH